MPSNSRATIKVGRAKKARVNRVALRVTRSSLLEFAGFIASLSSKNSRRSQRQNILQLRTRSRVISNYGFISKSRLRSPHRRRRPTGLVLALWLTYLGIPVRILDKTAENRAAIVAVFFRFNAARKLMFRTVSQTEINYRGSLLSEGCAGKVHVGDHLPWMKIQLSAADKDNFAPLASLDWQVHVYGNAAPDVMRVCSARKIPLHVFPWYSEMPKVRLWRHAIHLIRPDGPRGLAKSIATYFDKRKLLLPPSQEHGGSTQEN